MPFAGYEMSLSTQVLTMSDGDETRATLLNSGDAIPGNTFKLYGWENSSCWIDAADATYSAGKWSVPGTYNLKKTNDYTFLAYANLPSGATITAPESKSDDITLTVTDITAAQNDILLGEASVEKPTSGDVAIDFSHPYASVTFKVGNLVGVNAVTAISMTGLYSGGTTTLGHSSTTDGSGVTEYEWTDLGDANATLEATGLNKTEGQEIATFVVIPQDLSEKNAIVTITYNEGSKMTKLLSEDTWIAGYTTTYTLSKLGTIEISVSSKTIMNTGDTKIYIRAIITGGWYDASGDIVAPWNVTDGTFTGLPGTNWTKSDGIYYYTPGIASGSGASDLFTSYTKPSVPVTGATLKLDVLVQAIPFDVNKTCLEAFAAL